MDDKKELSAEEPKTNEVWIHKENGIINMKINGTELLGVTDYKIISPANDYTELMITIRAEPYITDLEIGLREKMI